jgi:hypothetical protein
MGYNGMIGLSFESVKFFKEKNRTKKYNPIRNSLYYKELRKQKNQYPSFIKKQDLA